MRCYGDAVTALDDPVLPSSVVLFIAPIVLVPVLIVLTTPEVAATEDERRHRSHEQQ
jgi:hypothetical protein